MKYSKVSAVVFGLSISFVLAGTSLSATENDIILPVPQVTAKEELTAPAAELMPKIIEQEKNLKYLIARGEYLINQRFASLSLEKIKVQRSNNSAEQKNSLIADIDKNTAGLAELLGKIKTAPDVAAAKTLVQSIYSDYRIYAIAIPRWNLTVSLNNIIKYLNKYQYQLVIAQAKIDMLKLDEVDTTARQAALEKAKQMLPDIKSRVEATLAKTIALKPADYPDASKKIFSEIRAELKQIRKMIADMNKELRKK